MGNMTVHRMGDPPPPPAYSPGYVYLIEVVGHKVYKIGCSTNPERRLLKLQTKKSYSLAIVATIYSTDYIQFESDCHRKFEHCRISHEWYAMTAADIEAFKGMAK